MKKFGASFLVAFFLLFAAVARADEGMWTFDNFPSAKVASAYGFRPDAAWLRHVRLASLRIAGGCSASFISPSGLVMTNHHCAAECIQQISTAQHDYITDGYYAKTQADEVKCPTLELNQLIDIANVTPQVVQALKGLSDRAYVDARKAVYARLSKACSQNGRYRCDVVSLYHGGIYDLYKYKRYQDVRLVFAPEAAMAFFGGDPDNFNFPRYDLDVSIVRAYEGGKPAATPEYLHWSKKGVPAGSLVFVSGNPGGTSRELTVAQLKFLRDVALPDRIKTLAEERGVIEQFQTEGKEQKRTSRDLLFGIENSYKGLNGREEALVDAGVFAKKVADENALRARINADPKTRARYGAVWDALAKADTAATNLMYPFAFEEGGRAFLTDYWFIAKTLVRAAAERKKSNEKRFPEFADATLPSLTFRLFNNAPIYNQLEEVKLTFSLTKMRELLGADDSFVRSVLGRSSPAQLAHDMVSRTTLGDVAVRKALWDGGQAAIDASTDPFIRLAVAIDPQARAVRKQFEDTVDAPTQKNSELLAQAIFAEKGTSIDPDATFTLRLSYGAVKGWSERGKYVDPITHFAGTFARATGADPFALPDSWLAAKPSLNMNTPMNFASTNDIIGGNSGSPVINKNAEVVGLIFDGNIHSLGGDYFYDGTTNRAVAVSSQALMAALRSVYHADRIANEIAY